MKPIRRPVQEIRPRPEFYEVYNEGQIHDLLADLGTHHELNFEYTYFDGGAQNWDSYVRQFG